VVLRVGVRCGPARAASDSVVEERRLGPVVGLGTWNTFGDDADLARAVVGAALESGCRTVDTSPMYGGAERSLAAALEGRREQAAVATKIWTPSVEDGDRQLARQLDWYGHVEIGQIHNLVAWREHLRWLEHARERGQVGRIGVTHYDRSALDELETALRTGRFTTVQVPYNPAERDCEACLLPLADELGVAVIAMRPLGGPRRRLLALEPSPEDLAPLEEFGVETWAQALLKWALSEHRIDLVVPATSKPERARSNAAAGSPPWLDEEARARVERLAGISLLRP
jgi:diketogulonate reductase-like aldo/keto reductase